MTSASADDRGPLNDDYEADHLPDGESPDRDVADLSQMLAGLTTVVGRLEDRIEVLEARAAGIGGGLG